MTEPEYQLVFPPTPAASPYCSEMRITLAKLGVIWVLFKMGNYEQALIWIELALTHSETQTATLMEHYGDILYFLTKKDAAVQAIEKWKAAKTLGAGSEQLSEKIKEGKWIE